jgi:uncharacterized protein YndB with AHSA1/START domain
MKNSIEFEMEYDFPVNEVWKVLTEKEAVSEWLMPCDIKAVVGHQFQFKTKPFPGFNGSILCEVLAVVENELLSFSWSGGPLKQTMVNFRLEKRGSKTKLYFEHSGFEGLLNRIIIKKLLSNGWKTKILPLLLKKYLEKNG